MTRNLRIRAAVLAAIAWLTALAALAPHTTHGTINADLVQTVETQP